MTTQKIQVGLRLYPAMCSKLRAIAKRENRTLNNMVEHIIRLYITNYEKDNGPVEAIGESD